MNQARRHGKAALPSGKGYPLRGLCSCASLRRLTRRVTQYYDQALKPSGLRVTQFSILNHIAQFEGVSLTELALRLDMDRTTLTRNLGPLEKAGWIEVAAGPDRRSRTARLTPSGATCLARAEPLWRAAEQSFRHRVGPEDAAQLRHLISGAMASLSGDAA